MSGNSKPATNQTAASSVSAIARLSASQPRSTAHGRPFQTARVSRVPRNPCENTCWLAPFIAQPSAAGAVGLIRNRRRRYEASVRTPPTADVDLRPSCGALHVVAEVVAEDVGADLFRGRLAGVILTSGAGGTRTLGLRHAMAALCQLSYSPKS